VRNGDIDYRHSHIGRGRDYDEGIAADPLDSYLDRREQVALLQILRQLRVGPATRILDFACGTGRLTQVLDGVAGECYAVDISESMVAVARSKCARTTFFVGDASQTRLPIPLVDVVTAFRFFGNAQLELRRAALKIIAAHLREGGYLIANNHRNPWAIRNQLARITGPHTRLDLSPRRFRALLHECGFRITCTYGIGLALIRARWQQSITQDSRIVERFDSLTKWGGLAQLCPDMIVVAQKLN